MRSRLELIILDSTLAHRGRGSSNDFRTCSQTRSCPTRNSKQTEGVSRLSPLSRHNKLILSRSQFEFFEESRQRELKIAGREDQSSEELQHEAKTSSRSCSLHIQESPVKIRVALGPGQVHLGPNGGGQNINLTNLTISAFALDC